MLRHFTYQHSVYRVDNPNLPGDDTCSLSGRKNKIKLVLEIVLPVIAAISLLFVAVLVLVILRRRKITLGN